MHARPSSQFPSSPLRHLRVACASGLLVAALGLVASSPVAAQLDPSPGLRATVYGASINSVFGGSFDSAAGVGLGLEYRLSRRLGVELTSFTGTIESRTLFDFFGFVEIDIDSSLEVAPLLAQLDWHLTPDHHVDLHVGPILGWMRYGDLETQVRTHIPGEDTDEVSRIRTKDSFAWGAHLDFDVPLGQRAFFTGGLTYLNAEVKAAPGQSEGLEGDTIFHFDPIVLKAGIGYRF